MAIMQTIIQYLIVIALLVAGFFFITSISLQDWMRVEASMKIPKEMFDTIKNQTSSMIPAGENKKEIDEFFDLIDEIPSDASIVIKDHFGLQKSCSYITMDGFKNPIKLVIPELKWCRDNEVFTKPTKYGLPAYVAEFLEDEAKALKNARICMILAILCVALAVVILLVKVFKWQKESVFATVILALLSCICVIAALGVVHNNFNFKKDFDRMKYSLRSTNRYGGRKRRDDGSSGYSGRYTTTEGPQFEMRTPSIAGGGSVESGGSTDILLGEFGQILMSIFLRMELTESVGSPLRMAGFGVGFLLLVIILNGVEFYLIRKHGGVEIKYHNVELV